MMKLLLIDDGCVIDYWTVVDDPDVIIALRDSLPRSSTTRAALDEALCDLEFPTK